jgi:hypothetical protein
MGGTSAWLVSDPPVHRQPDLVPRHQNEVVAAICKTIGKYGADSAGSSGDEGIPFEEELLMLRSIKGSSVGQHWIKNSLDMRAYALA